MGLLNISYHQPLPAPEQVTSTRGAKKHVLSLMCGVYSDATTGSEPE